jgi:hypothetical protein
VGGEKSFDRERDREEGGGRKMNYKQGRPTWVPDNSASACVKCKQAFSFDIRRVCDSEIQCISPVLSPIPPNHPEDFGTAVAAPGRCLTLASYGSEGFAASLRARPCYLNARPSPSLDPLSRHQPPWLCSQSIPSRNNPSSPSLAGPPST